MRLRYAWILMFLISASSLANQQVWLIRCTSSGPPLDQIKESLKRRQINVLNSLERRDSAVSEHCASGEKLQAFYIWEFQKSQAKEAVSSLRDAPEKFDPKPPKRVH